MDTTTSKFDMHAVRTRDVNISLHAMCGDSAEIAIEFRDARSFCGLKVGFHMSAAEARELAANLVEFADAAEADQAKLDEVTA